MGEIFALALKSGVVALPVILESYGLFAALFAFFAFMPLGHLTIGVLLVIVGLFCPKVPAHEEKHRVKVGAGQIGMEMMGSPRTALFAIGALVIVGSFAESAFLSSSSS